MDGNEVVECSYESTVGDRLTLRRYLTLRKSAWTGRIMAWMYVLLGVLVGAVYFLRYLSFRRDGIFDQLDIIRVVASAILVTGVLFGERAQVSWQSRRSVGCLGPTQIRISSDYLFVRTPDSEVYTRWKLYDHLEFHKGDIYVFYAKQVGIRIPGRAFQTIAEADAAYNLMSRYHSLATKFGTVGGILAPEPNDAADDGQSVAAGPVVACYRD